MKYLSFTFDDGRYDNYQFAWPILKKCGFTATLFCTTGYIDGTWRSATGWKTAQKPITVEQLKELKSDGWEISLHGDKHATQENDLRVCIKKLDSWGFAKDLYGFSLPNSSVNDSEIQRIISSDFGKQIGYIRRGRKTNTAALSSKVLYCLYTYLKLKQAYRAFNKQNVSDMRFENRYALPAVVIKMSDNPNMVFEFIDSLPDDTHAILMFHSIMPKEDFYFGRDEYCWSTDFFEDFCKKVSLAVGKNRISVGTVIQIMDLYR